MPEAVQVSDAAATVVNRWAWWQNALKGEFGPIHDGDPQQGYFRTKRKGGDWEPVAIWQDEDTGQWLAYRNGQEVRADDIWTWCCRNPITYAAYEKALAYKTWDDEPPASIGDNSGDVDPFEAIRIELIGERETAEPFLKADIKTQADADKAAVWAKRLTDIKNRAETMRKAEKEPFLEGGRAVDAKWKEITDSADTLAKTLKRHVEPFLIAQRRAEEERQRKAREEAEAARAAELEALKKAQEGDEKAAQEAADARARAEAAEREAEAKRSSAGRTGAKVSIRVEKTGVVTDYAKAAAALVAMNHADIKSVIDQLANRAAKSGMPFDGMEIREIEKAV